MALAALLPCQWSYGEIGKRLAACGAPADPVYADWIALFSGDGYDDLVRASTGLLDSWAGVADQAAAEAAFDASDRVRAGLLGDGLHPGRQRRRRLGPRRCAKGGSARTLAS